MSRSLYRKYRPSTFSDVVGQAHIVDTLRNAVNEGRVTHAYLFSGPRGTGKTTMARLLSKALLCENMEPAGPDGTCRQCVEIAEGEHPDVYELDAASRTGVENVREEIIGRVDFAPVRGDKKIYIIDEVHMLSTPAFNALLKTIEEPPSHVTFVLCTTDPQKVPETILSRCQHFEFHRIPDVEIIAHLKSVARSEGIELSDGAASLIAVRSRGGMRDALTTLEQLAVFGSGTVTDEDARDLLGEIGGDLLSHIATSIAQRDVAEGFSWVRELSERGTDLGHFAKEFTSFMRDIYVVSIVGDGQALDGAYDEAALELIADQMGSPDRIARILTIMSDLTTEMRRTSDQRLALEIAFTRMARPDSDLTLDALADRIGELELALDRMKHRLDSGAVAQAPVQQPTAQEGEKPAASPAPTAVQKPEPAQAPAPVQADEPKTAQAPMAEPAPAPAPIVAGSAADMPPSLVQRSWDQVRKNMMKEAPSRGVLLQQAHAEVLKDGTLLVELPAGASFAKTMLEKDDIKQLVTTQIDAAFGQRMPWRVCLGEVCDTVPEEHPAPASAPAPAPAPEPKPAPEPAVEPEPEPEPAPEPEAAPVPDPVPETTPEPTAQPAPEPAAAPAPEPEAEPDLPPLDVYETDAPSSVDPDIADLLKESFGDVVITEMDED